MATAKLTSAPPRTDLSALGSAASQRPAPKSDGTLILWLMTPVVSAVIAWSFWGVALVDPEMQQAVLVAGIVLTGLIGIGVASYVRHRNVEVERAYSVHLEELSQRLRSLAYQGSLTDLYNHRYFYDQLSHEVERAQRYGRPVSVILLDLDKFKEVNDTYGHLMGDKLLTLMGQVIKDNVRAADIPARYGGDEFAIILPDTPHAAAQATAEKLARAIAIGRTNAGPMNEGLPLSASYGVATCPDEARSVSELLQAADDRVYQNKTALRLQDPLAPTG
jgi:diguanylate cyclase (GGDEF)-like protein